MDRRTAATAAVLAAGMVAIWALWPGGPREDLSPPATLPTKVEALAEASPQSPPPTARTRPALPPVEATPAGATVRFAGRVLLPDGEPAKGATVTITAFDVETIADGEYYENATATDAEGRFAMEVPGTDTTQAVVEARKEGYAGANTAAGYGRLAELADVLWQQRDSIELRLYEEADVSGRLFYPEGEPAGGYELEAGQFPEEPGMYLGLPFPNAGTTTTGEDGAFRLHGLRPGAFQVSALKDEQLYQTWKAHAPDGDLVLTLSDADRLLAGRVYQLDTGFAVPGAEVTLIRIPAPVDEAFMSLIMGLANEREAASTVADNAGRYTFRDVRPGRYRLYAEDPTGDYRLRSAEVDGVEPVSPLPDDILEANTLFGFELPEDFSHTHADLYLSGGDRIHGRVRLKGTEQYVEGADVKLEVVPLGGPAALRQPESHATVTDAEGRYSFDRVFHSGLAQLAATKSGHHFAGVAGGVLVPPMSFTHNGMAAVILPADGDRESEFLLEMSTELTISGSVRHADGAPVADAAVRFNHDGPLDWFSIFGGRWTPVDANGEFSLPARSQTTGNILVRTEEATGLSSGVFTVENHPVTNIDIVLEGRARVSGRVTDAEGRALPRASVMLTPVGPREAPFAMGREVTVDSDADGRFRFENLAPGEFVLSASLEGYAGSEDRWIRLAAEEEKGGVELTLRQASELQIRVVDEEGKPLRGVNVMLSTERAGPLLDTRLFSLPITNADGIYTHNRVPDGPIEIRLSHSGYESKTVSNFVPANDEVPEFVLEERKERSLTVHIIDGETGEPIEAFSVRPLDTGLPLRRQPLEKDPGYFVDRNVESYSRVEYMISAEGYADAHLDGGWFGDRELERTETVRLYPGAEVTGRLMDRNSDAPLAGVRIVIYVGPEDDHRMGRLLRDGTPLTSTFTAEDGTFRFERVTGGELIVAVRPSPPYFDRMLSIEHDGRHAFDVGDVFLGTGGTIRVQVSRGEEPVSGVAVTLSSSDRAHWETRRGVTNEDGIYTFESVPAASYSAEAEGQRAWVDDLEDGESREAVIQLGGNTLVLELRRGDEPYPTGDADTVFLQGSNRVSRVSTGMGSGNTHQFENLPAGRYYVSLSFMDHPVWHVQLWNFASFELAGDEERREVLDLPGGEIRGMVLNADGEEVTTPGVVWQRLDEWETDYWFRRHAPPSSDFGVTMLPAGTYWFRAMHPDFGSAEETIELGEDEVRDNVQLLLRREDTGTLVSVTLRHEDASPLEGAFISVLTPDGRNYSPAGIVHGKEGTATVQELPPGDYTAHVWAEREYSREEHAVTIEAGETVYIDSVLYQAGRLTWRLMEDEETPLTEAQVGIVPLEDGGPHGSVEATVRDNGWVTVSNLFPGPYRAEATLPDGTVLTETFVINPAESLRITTHR